MVIRREALAAASSHKWRPRGHRHRTTKRRAIIWLQRGGPGPGGAGGGRAPAGTPPRHPGGVGSNAGGGGLSAAGPAPRWGGKEGRRRRPELGGPPVDASRCGPAGTPRPHRAEGAGIRRRARSQSRAARGTPAPRVGLSLCQSCWWQPTVRLFSGSSRPGGSPPLCFRRLSINQRTVTGCAHSH